MEWDECLADFEVEWFEAGAVLYCPCGARVCLIDDMAVECPLCHTVYRLTVKVEGMEVEYREYHNDARDDSGW